MSEACILIIEDDADISSPLSNFLITKGYETALCDSAEAAHQWLKKKRPDLILLDLMLPGESGLEFFQKVRTADSPPMIMVTALGDPIDNIVGLELGADDYVAKPFDLNVLLARIRAVIRRYNSTRTQPEIHTGEPVLAFGDFTFYPLRRNLRTPADIRKPLTAGETDLLMVFCQHVDKVLSREDLLELTRSHSDVTSTRSIDLLVSRLRRKLTSDANNVEFIQTFRNNGYMFKPEVRRI